MINYGDPLLPDRFWDKVEIVAEASTFPGPCWIWTASENGRGYGVFYIRPRRFGYSHRHSYATLVGAIPDGLQLDHLCRIRFCCNPMHLEPVTARVNLLRGDTITARNAARTHCPQGHAYSEENTRLYKGNRLCRECDRHAARDYSKKKFSGPRRRLPDADPRHGSLAGYKARCDCNPCKAANTASLKAWRQKKAMS